MARTAVTAPSLSAPACRGTHRRLLRIPSGRSARTLDAVVVATTWSVDALGGAAALARELGATLVALCSREATASDVATLADRLSTMDDGCEPDRLDWLAVDVPDGYQHPLFGFATSRASEAKVERLGDLSLKRNLGLTLATLLGWESALFLDEDITDLDADDVRHATASLGELAMVGLEVADFPDNSVVCHAHRLAGGRQDTFVSGSALLVDVGRAESFFPDVYNEDWLFLFDAACLRLVGRTGEVGQLPYEPFRNPERAVGEEFGDVLAEGLMELAHLRLPRAVADDPGYWHRFLARRREFIAQIAGRITDLPASPLRAQALTALHAAEDRRAAITPASCAAYLRTWDADTRAWASRTRDLPRTSSLRSALELLGLAGDAMSPRLDGRTRKGTTMIPGTVDCAATARVAPTAQLGAPYRLLQEGEWDRLHRPTVIGEGCDIGHFCVVGEEAQLGAGTILDTYCLVEGGATLGERVIVTHRASVGARAVVGHDSVIGCSLVCERSRIGNRCRVFGDLVHRQLDPTRPWDAPEAEESSPILEDGVFVGWGATVVGGITIGEGAYICAGATVTKDVAAGRIVTGSNDVSSPQDWKGSLGKSEFFRSAVAG